MKDSKGADVNLGDVVLIPMKVTKLGGRNSPLIQLETVERYGHDNGVVGPLSGLTRWSFWAEPTQVEVVSANADRKTDN